MGINCAPLLANLLILFVRGRINIGASQEKRKEANPGL
jgi:hypothetical protein